MSTTSLRRDHELIEKVIKAMQSTIELLNNNTKIPESILLPVIDFSKILLMFVIIQKKKNHYFLP